MKKIIDVNSKISIWTDKSQYVVKIASKKLKETNDQQFDYWYLPSLVSCYEEIYEDLLKDKLTENVSKDIEELKAVHEGIKKYIRNHFKEA